MCLGFSFENANPFLCHVNDRFAPKRTRNETRGGGGSAERHRPSAHQDTAKATRQAHGADKWSGAWACPFRIEARVVLRCLGAVCVRAFRASVGFMSSARGLYTRHGRCAQHTISPFCRPRPPPPPWTPAMKEGSAAGGQSSSSSSTRSHHSEQSPELGAGAPVSPCLEPHLTERQQNISVRWIDAERWSALWICLK